jgi:hypothetical protein
MIRRALQKVLLASAAQAPIVTLTGPRQSGKTTLLKAVFPRHDYVSLEEPDQREFALQDPRGFLRQFSGPAALDEVQRVPALFSYIQTLVDEEPAPGRFILSGSQNFLLLESVSQSLAGRCVILHLLPLSLSELDGRAPLPITAFGRQVRRRRRSPRRSVMDTLFQGFYPRIHAEDLDPHRWLRDYYRTYVERDVRQIVNVGDIETFGRFVRLCAGRNGQLLNLSSLANDCGITHSTARRWLSILEASFLVILLRPHHRNFNKRLIKAPKLYFLDSGLLCYLLRIRSPEDLRFHAMRGSVFETYVVSELLKNSTHRGEEPDLYFWRDASGREIDVLLEVGRELIPLEIKSAETVAADFLSGLQFWRKLVKNPEAPAALVHAGERSFRRDGVAIYAWSDL